MTIPDNPRVVVPPPLLFTGLLARGLIINSGPRASGAMHFAAIALGLAGLTVIALALNLFRTSKTRPEPWQPASTLVSGGIYRITRNPMYLGMATVSLSVAMFFTSLPAVFLTMLAVMVIDRTVIKRD